MTKHLLRVLGFALFLFMLPVCGMVARAQTRVAKMTVGSDLVSEESLAGRYPGVVQSGGKTKRATLTIKEELDNEGTNFLLQIEGEDEPIRGRIAGGSYHSKTIFASLVVFSDAEMLPLDPSSALSLRVKKIGDRVTLKSSEQGKQFSFDTCLPPPACQRQPGCEPC